MTAWIIFCTLVMLSFFIPGGMFTILFFGMVFASVWIPIALIIMYFRELTRK